MTTLAQLLGSKKGGYYTGEIGLEIETETIGGYTYVDGLEKYWSIHPDGSLRNNGVEYVFRQPYTPGQGSYETALALFAEQAKATKFIESVYTSVHVHLNMLDKQLTHMMNFITLYYIFEEVLVEYCGNTRNGNLFCLKTSNAEVIYRTVNELAKSIEEGMGYTEVRNLHSNGLKYSALNIAPLRNFGSLEIRTHPGCNDVALIDRWVKSLHMIYKKATTFASPVEVIERLHGSHSKGEFFRLILEEYARYFNLTDLDNKTRNGIWYATSLAATVDNWKDFGSKKAEVKSSGDQLRYYIDNLNQMPAATDVFLTTATTDTVAWQTIRNQVGDV